jgi:hypothetical protein
VKAVIQHEFCYWKNEMSLTHLANYWRSTWLVSIIALCCFHSAFASEATVRIAKFADVAGWIRYTVQSSLPQIRDSQPELAAFIEHSLKYIHDDDIAARSASIFDDQLSDQDVRYLDKLIGTKTGRKMARLFKETKENKDIDEALRLLTVRQQKDIHNILQSPAWRHVIAVFRSQDMDRIMAKYAEDLKCECLKSFTGPVPPLVRESCDLRADQP